jgi:hypothetical protein
MRNYVPGNGHAKIGARKARKSDATGTSKFDS